MREKRQFEKYLLKAALAILLFAVCMAGVLTEHMQTVQAAAASADQSATGLYDEGQLLTAEEASAVEKKIEDYAKKYQADIAIVTTLDARGQTAQAYADACAEKIGQSMTEDGYPGILFFIDMDNREIYIATQGKAIDWYDAKRIDKILDACYDQIIDGDYKGTCDTFLKGVRDYMGREAGRSARMGLLGVLLRLVIALAVGGAATFAMVYRRGGKITAGAATYFNAAQSHLDGREDRFMNRTVTRRHIPKPENQNSGGGHSGGSNVHMSSGGGMHGGGGRKF